jgi:hypothetical protein
MNDAPGVNSTYWWVGQVVDEKNWQKSTAGKIHKPTDTKGEVFSYKVRIVGRHTTETPDIDLPTASVALPVTAGGGLAGSVQTPNVRQGSYVIGFYRDGKDGNEPFIAFVLPINPKTPLFPGNPQTGFTARSGFNGENGQKTVSTSNISISQNGTTPTESVDPHVYSVNKRDQYVDGKRFFYLPKTKACEGPSGPLKGIQKNLGDAIATLNLIKSGVLGSTSDLQGLLENQISSYQTQITALTKTLIDSMRSFVLNKINNELSSKLEKFEPQLRIKYSKDFESANDIVFCIFQKILNKLPNLIASLFNQIIDKYISAPLCAAENFVAGILSDVFGDLSDGINSALAFSGIGNIQNQLLSGLDVFIGVLEFLTCEEDLNCEMPDQWSIFGGAKRILGDVNAKVNKKIESLIDDPESSSCNTSQLPCGPPTINFISNSGSGAAGNPIVSATGSLLGIDLISGGRNYNNPPTIEITDNCGNGGGASAMAIMKNDNSGTIDKIVIIDGGSGYLQYPNGSTGANGFTFSNPDDTIIFNANSGYNVYSCNTTVNVNKNDLIYLKTLAFVNVYRQDGEILQELIGLGPTIPITIEYDGTITTPPCSDTIQDFKGEFPSTDSSYPVVLTIDDIALTNSGANYSSGDKIIISPSNGAELNVYFDKNGAVNNVVVVNGGIGFTEIPTITIESKTGFNSGFIPIFKILRIGDLKEDQDKIPLNTPTINVIDCVGFV